MRYSVELAVELIMLSLMIPSVCSSYSLLVVVIPPVRKRLQDVYVWSGESGSGQHSRAAGDRQRNL